MIAKRCGHLGGKELVDEATFLARIRAAAAARKKVGDIVLIARTDALQSLGFDAAINRLKRAVEAGADMAFLEGMTSKEQMERAVKELVSISIPVPRTSLTDTGADAMPPEHGERGRDAAR